jgi:hypothetical protein
MPVLLLMSFTPLLAWCASGTPSNYGVLVHRTLVKIEVEQYLSALLDVVWTSEYNVNLFNAHELCLRDEEVHENHDYRLCMLALSHSLASLVMRLLCV